jgi:hypothetical protein
MGNRAVNSLINLIYMADIFWRDVFTNVNTEKGAKIWREAFEDIDLNQADVIIKDALKDFNFDAGKDLVEKLNDLIDAILKAQGLLDVEKKKILFLIKQVTIKLHPDTKYGNEEKLKTIINNIQKAVKKNDKVVINKIAKENGINISF